MSTADDQPAVPTTASHDEAPPPAVTDAQETTITEVANPDANDGSTTNHNDTVHQTETSAQEETKQQQPMTEAEVSPPPGSNHKSRHVVFSTEVRVADVVFQQDRTEKEVESELDVYERLYREAQKRLHHPAPTVAVPAAATEGQDEKNTDSEAAPASGGDQAQPNAQKHHAAAAAAPPAAARSMDAKETKEMAECTFKPQITDMAKGQRKLRNWDEFVKLQTDWVKLQERKGAERVKRADFELGIGQPLYDDIKRPHSMKILDIMEKQKLYKPPHESYRRPLHQKRSPSGSHNTTTVTNNNDTTNKSRSSSGGTSQRRDAAVDPALFDRLYHDATIREAALRVIEQTQIEKEARELFRPSTNESFWHSGTMLGARTPSSHRALYEDPMSGLTLGSETSVVEELLAKGEEYKLRREQRVIEKLNQPEVYTFKPQTNPNSKRIIIQRALERELEQREAFEGEEVARETRSRERVCMDGEDPAKKPKAKFDPEIFVARMHRRDVEKAQRLSSLRRALKVEEVSECTFRPAITKKSAESGGIRTSVPAAAHSTPRSARGASEMNVESYSPEYNILNNVSSPSVSTSAMPHLRNGGSGAAVESSQMRRPVDNANSSRHQPSVASARNGAPRSREPRRANDVVDDGDGYLKNLEDELRGVIAEWTSITADASNQL